MFAISSTGEQTASAHVARDRRRLSQKYAGSTRPLRLDIATVLGDVLLELLECDRSGSMALVLVGRVGTRLEVTRTRCDFSRALTMSRDGDAEVDPRYRIALVGSANL